MSDDYETQEIEDIVHARIEDGTWTIRDAMCYLDGIKGRVLIWYRATYPDLYERHGP